MKYTIFWTSNAKITFNQNLEYLSKEWDNKTILRFLDRVDEVIKNISNNPMIYPLYRKENAVRKSIINPRIILYFKVVNNTTIDLLLFWNTHQDMERLHV